MKKSKEAAQRARRIILRDKTHLPDNFNEVLVGDINKLLSHYMEIDRNGAKLKITVMDDGSYELKIIAYAERIKDIPVCLPSVE